MRICLRGEGSLRVTKLDGRARAYSVHANHKCNQVIGSISGGIGHMSRPRLSLGDRGRRRRLEREGRKRGMETPSNIGLFTRDRSGGGGGRGPDRNYREDRADGRGTDGQPKNGRQKFGAKTWVVFILKVRQVSYH